MKASLEILLRNIETSNPPAGLSKTVIQRIRREEKLLARKKFAVFGTLTAFSFFAIIAEALRFWQSVGESGFVRYLSLFLSDGTIIMGYWKEMAMSLAESLPVVCTAILLSAIALFIWSVSKTAKNSRLAFYKFNQI